MDSAPSLESDRVVVAEIVRPRGLKGELFARSQTDIPGRLEMLKEANARLKTGTDTAVTIEKVWPHKGEWVVKLAGVDSIEAAEPFRGADLWVRLENRAPLPEGEFYRSDLIGCRLFDAATGAEVGIVEGWQQYGSAPPLMEVRLEKIERLIPFVAAECQVDLAGRTIRAALPEGLLDL